MNTSLEKEYNRVKRELEQLNKINERDKERLERNRQRLRTVNNRIQGRPREVGHHRARERRAINHSISITRNSMNRRFIRHRTLQERLVELKNALRRKYHLPNKIKNAVYNQIVNNARKYFNN
jgi:hypothetical protein